MILFTQNHFFLEKQITFYLIFKLFTYLKHIWYYLLLYTKYVINCEATQFTLYKKEMMVDAILSVSLVAIFF